MIWYKFHVGDYLTHTLHLSDAEDLAYRRMLDLYYMSEKPLPPSPEAVARKIRLDLDITESVLAEFFTKTEEGYRHTRCDAELARYQRQVESNRASGAKGGRPKTESVTDSEPTTNPNQIQIQKKNKTISSAAPTRFADFWECWPRSHRKVGRATCEAKWKRHGFDAIADRIIAYVGAMKESDQWKQGFEPAPLTFLNQRRWEDEESPVEAFAGRRVV